MAKKTEQNQPDAAEPQPVAVEPDSPSMGVAAEQEAPLPPVVVHTDPDTPPVVDVPDATDAKPSTPINEPKSAQEAIEILVNTLREGRDIVRSFHAPGNQTLVAWLERVDSILD